jgi:hypothetical protein
VTIDPAQDDLTETYKLPLENHGGQWKAGKAEPWLKSSFNETNPVFSPDGR